MIQERYVLTIFGMDVVVLYPSINKEMAKSAIRKAINIEGTTWTNLSIKHITRIVSLLVDRVVIERLHLDKVIPIPKRTTTLNSYLDPKGMQRVLMVILSSR